MFFTALSKDIFELFAFWKYLIEYISQRRNCAAKANYTFSLTPKLTSSSPRSFLRKTCKRLSKVCDAIVKTASRAQQQRFPISKTCAKTCLLDLQASRICPFCCFDEFFNHAKMDFFLGFENLDMEFPVPKPSMTPKVKR